MYLRQSIGDGLHGLSEIEVRGVSGVVEKGAQGLDERIRVFWYGVREGIQVIGQASQDVRGRPGCGVERVLEIRSDLVAEVPEGGEVRYVVEECRTRGFRPSRLCIFRLTK